MAIMGGDKRIKEYGACDEFGKCGDDVIVDSGFKPCGRGNVGRNFFRNQRRNAGVPFLPQRPRPLAFRDGNLPVIGHNVCFQVSPGQCTRVLHTGNSIISERCFSESGEEVVNPEQFANYTAISTIKDDRTWKNESKYEQTRCDRENIMPGVGNNDCRRIGKPLSTVNCFGGRTPCNNDRAHGMSKSGVSRCHAPTAGFCSSYLVGVKHRDVITDAQNHHTRGLDMGLSLGTISLVVETYFETYSNSPAPGKYKKMNYSDARLFSPTSTKASDAVIEDVTMSADLTQFSLVPPSNVLNGLSSESPFNAVLEGVQDHVFQGPLGEPPFGENIDEQLSSIKGNQRHCKIIEEISSNLAAFYYPPDTRVLQSIKASDIECVKELGSGTYGTVYHGKWKGSDVAIKKLNSSCLSVGAVTEKRLVADFWKEAYLLGQLHHPNVVTLYGVVTDGPVTNLATVTEYMVNGSLKQFLHRKDRTIDRRKRLIMAMDAAFGMEYLHDRNIVHFDLKSHNFLVNMKDPQRPICKIGDFGLSKVKQRTLISGGVRGTIPWMAPELLDSDNLVSEKVDVYSFGIVMWELLTGEEPYANLRSEQIIAGIIKGSLRPEVPNWCDPFWRSLMERCWSSDPDSRPSFSDIAKELRSMSATMNIK